MDKFGKFLLFASTLKIFVRLAMGVLFAWLGFRVARILGHWEYGLVLFLFLGYQINLSSYLNDIKMKLSGRIV